MGEFQYLLRPAGVRDIKTVRGLLDEASEWLRKEKSTDQWAEPWPDEVGRNQRIRGAIRAGRTWIAWDGAQAAATLTTSPNGHEIWPEENQRDPAVYVRRLVVGRSHAGNGLGGQLLDWAGLRASHRYDARWVRVDVWTTNTELHSYYEHQGFEFCGFCETVTDYPAAALFQKRADDITPPKTPLFSMAEDG